MKYVRIQASTPIITVFGDVKEETGRDAERGQFAQSLQTRAD